MTIDIDSFLEKQKTGFKSSFNKNNNSKLESIENLENSNPINNLNFEVKVEKDLEDITQISKDNNLNVLSKLYNEVKKFDSDLINKFSKIELKGSDVLNDLSKKYSSKYLKNLNSRVNIVSNLLDKNIINFNSYLKLDDFEKLYKEYNLMLANYNSFPNEFLSLKLKYLEKVKSIEINFNKKIYNFKNGKLLLIKSKLNKCLIFLEKSLKLKNKDNILKCLSFISSLLNKIPVYFLSDISLEKIKISKLVRVSEIYLNNEFLNDYNYKRKVIYSMFEKFRKYYLSSNLDKLLLTYDEILLSFKTMPNVNLEDKLDLNNKINNLNSDIHKLMLNLQVSTLIQGYNNAKILQETKDYLKESKLKKSVNVENLKLLKQNLMKVSDKYIIERNELLKIINLVLSKFEVKNKNTINYVSKKENKIFDNNNLEKKNEIKNKVEIKINKKTTGNNLPATKNYNKLKNLPFNKNIINKNKRINNYVNNKSNNLKNLNKEKIEINRNINFNDIFSQKIILNNKQNKSIFVEIENYYNLIMVSKNNDEIKSSLEKILFYLNLLSISNEDKLKIKSKFEYIVMCRLKK